MAKLVKEHRKQTHRESVWMSSCSFSSNIRPVHRPQTEVVSCKFCHSDILGVFLKNNIVCSIFAIHFSGCLDKNILIHICTNRNRRTRTITQFLVDFANACVFLYFLKNSLFNCLLQIYFKT